MASERRRFKLARHVRWREPRLASGPKAGEGAGRMAMEGLKFEVARDLGLDDDIQRRGFANMTTRKVGKIGGHMVRRLVRHAKEDLESGEEP